MYVSIYVVYVCLCVFVWLYVRQCVCIAAQNLNWIEFNLKMKKTTDQNWITKYSFRRQMIKFVEKVKILLHFFFSLFSSLLWLNDDVCCVCLMMNRNLQKRKPNFCFLYFNKHKIHNKQKQNKKQNKRKTERTNEQKKKRQFFFP